MISISVRTDIQQLVRKLDSVQREQVPFAASRAINAVAIDVQAAISDETRAKLDAKPFTTGRGALYVQRSNKRRLMAEVGFKTIQARYMQYQVAGGRRSHKGFEGALRGLGVLPPGFVTVPGAGIRLDGYGNIPRRVLTEILGQLRSRKGTFQGRGKRLTLRAPFVVLPGNRAERTKHLAPGIWQRINDAEGTGTLRPLILYIDGADYRARIDLQRTANNTVAARFSGHMRAELAAALASAR